MSERWLRLAVPTDAFERCIFGPLPLVIDEAPKGMGREVRLASVQETGLFACRALPPAEAEPKEGEP